MNIHCKIDDFFTILMNKLNLQIPTFKLHRWVEIQIEESKSGKETLQVQGLTETGGAYDIFKSVSIDGVKGYSKALTEDQMQEGSEFKVKLQFQGHYDEPDVTLTIPRALIKASENKVQVSLRFDPNVENAQLKGIRGNWEEPTAYFNQKIVLGQVIYTQGQQAAAKAAANGLAKQFEKKMNLAPASKAPGMKSKATQNKAPIAKTGAATNKKV